MRTKVLVQKIGSNLWVSVLRYNENGGHSSGAMELATENSVFNDNLARLIFLESKINIKIKDRVFQIE